MSRRGLKSQVYHGEVCLGELDVIVAKDRKFEFPNNEIRIQRISPASERCHPLSILQTIASFSVCCKLESSSPVEHPHLINLHATCHYELKVCVHILLSFHRFTADDIAILVFGCRENACLCSSFSHDRSKLFSSYCFCSAFVIVVIFGIVFSVRLNYLQFGCRQFPFRYGIFALIVILCACLSKKHNLQSACVCDRKPLLCFHFMTLLIESR